MGILKRRYKNTPRQKHNALQLQYNLNFPYCPKTYRNLLSVNRHLYRNSVAITSGEIYYYYLLIAGKYVDIFVQEIP